MPEYWKKPPYICGRRKEWNERAFAVPASKATLASTVKKVEGALDVKNAALLGMADDVAMGAARTSTSLVETVDGILKPGGNIIGKAGSNASIRELSGGIEVAQGYWNRLVTSGAKPVLGSSYKGTLMELPNGGTIGFRTMMSRSPGTAATIDVNIPGFFQGKLKFNP